MPAVSNNGTSQTVSYFILAMAKAEDIHLFVDTFTSGQQQENSLNNSDWSKEALFGLLGMLAVLVVPCIGLLLKCSSRAFASRFLRSKASLESGKELL
jgi:hypothetical protein